MCTYDDRIVQRIRLALCSNSDVQYATDRELLSAYMCWCIEGTLDWDYFPRLLDYTVRQGAYRRMGYTMGVAA